MSRLLKPTLLLTSLLIVAWGVKNFMSGDVPLPTPAAPAVAPVEVAPAATPSVVATEAEATPAVPAPAVTPEVKPEAKPEAAATVPDLGDIIYGNSNAPVTIVAYESLTCSHCADFSLNVFPKIKAQYVDTGKVRYIFRDYPLDGAALKVAMLSRCAGTEKRPALVETLFAEQKNWLEAATMDEAVTKAIPYVKLAGLSDTQINTCLADEALKSAVAQSRKSGEEQKIDATPAFVINDKKLDSAPTEENIRAAIEAALPK